MTEYKRASYDTAWQQLTGDTAMEPYEVKSNISHLRNWKVPISGSDVTVALGVSSTLPSRWLWSTWRNDRDLIDSGYLDLPGLSITGEQAARVIFLLEFDYANATRPQDETQPSNETVQVTF